MREKSNEREKRLIEQAQRQELNRQREARLENRVFFNNLNTYS